MKKLAIFALAAAGASSLAATVTLAPKNSFSGDGWLSPGETNGWLDTANNTRGFAYNSATGNLIVLSRTGAAIPPPNGPQARIVNGTTGDHDPLNPAHFLNQGTGVITGGTFLMSMVAADNNGNIYISNLATSAGANYQLYKWAGETAAAPTVAISQSGFTRLGDSLDLFQSGSTVTIGAGGTGYNNYVRFQDTGAGFGAGSIFSTGASAHYRLSHTFRGSADLTFAKQTSNNLQVGSISGSTLTLTDGTAITSAGECPMDYAVVGGVPLLAVMDVNNSNVRVYDVTNPNAPVLLATGTTTSGTLSGNTNATGQVRWGAISGGSATLYAMSTNQGIQAFDVTVASETTISGTLSLNGWDGVDPIGDMTFKVIPDVGTPETKTVSVAADGSYSFTTTVEGSASVFITGRTALSKKVTGLTLSGGTVTVSPSLGNGDANDDDSCDLLDYFALSDSYNLALGDSGYDANSDFNGDDSVDLLDYFILSDNYNLVGDGE